MIVAYRRYNTFVLAVCILTTLAAYGGLFARWRGDDFYDAPALAEVLNESDGLASTFAVPFFQFKKAIFDVRKPDIVVVGSSRGLMFRQSAFRQEFANLGGGGHTPEYGFALLDTVFINHPPKVILYAVDHWAFLPTSDPVEERPYIVGMPAHRVQSNSALLVYRLLFDGLLRPGQFKRLIGLEPLVPQPLPTFGMALKSSRVIFGGFGADGSTYGVVHRESNETPRERFASQLACLEKNQGCDGPMRPAAHYDPRRVAQLKRLLAEFRSRGIYVVPFLAPMPPMVMSAFQRNSAFGYLPELRAALKREVPQLYDLMDADGLGASDCEFLDGIHAGEVADLRVLLEIARRDSVAATAIDTGRIRSTIDRYKNALMAVTDGPTEALSAFIDRDRIDSSRYCAKS